MEEKIRIKVVSLAKIDVHVTSVNGIRKLEPLTSRAEEIFAEIKCAKFGKTLLVQEKMFQGMHDYLVMHKHLCVAEETTEHQNQN